MFVIGLSTSGIDSFKWHFSLGPAGRTAAPAISE